jgi:cytoskeletal protein CcmA (bactofilin family)
VGVAGKLEGDISASDRVDLKQSAIVTGNIATQRISIDEGAYFKGNVNILDLRSYQASTRKEGLRFGSPGSGWPKTQATETTLLHAKEPSTWALDSSDR